MSMCLTWTFQQQIYSMKMGKQEIVLHHLLFLLLGIFLFIWVLLYLCRLFCHDFYLVSSFYQFCPLFFCGSSLSGIQVRFFRVLQENRISICLCLCWDLLVWGTRDSCFMCSMCCCSWVYLKHWLFSWFLSSARPCSFAFCSQNWRAMIFCNSSLDHFSGRRWEIA